jgi:hypothetical protein
LARLLDVSLPRCVVQTEHHGSPGCIANLANLIEVDQFVLQFGLVDKLPQDREAGLVVLALAYPLARSLDRTIEQGKPQPATYPLTKAVEEAVVEYVKRTPEVDLLAAGRPASMHDKADVVIVLTSPRPVPTNNSVLVCCQGLTSFALRPAYG